jgi:succinoglycan biosynthesis transport protein ExoP
MSEFMASIDDSQGIDDSAPRVIGPVQPAIADVLGIARRGWLFIVAGGAFGLVCALIALFIIPPTYKASSRIAFERTLPRYMQTNKVTNEPIIDDYDTLGQTYVIASESILLKVIRSLSLAGDPDFVREKQGETRGSQGDDAEKTALDNLVRNLTVAREDVSSVMTVAFTGKDPVKAATIANAIVDTYISDSIAEKMKSSSVAFRVVQQRVDELRQQVQDAERALTEYKMANNLVGTAKTPASSEQLDALQTNLANARGAMAETKARMDVTASDPAATALLGPNNEYISKLRTHLQDLSNRSDEIESLVGKSHLAAIKVRNQMQDVRKAIAAEQERIAASLAKDYEVARARYDAISAAISRVVSEQSTNSDVQARMHELEGSVDSLRKLYDQMLQQSSQMSKVEAQPSITPDVRVLNRATAPLQTESSKKRLLIFAGGPMMGLLLGFAFVFARSSPFGVLRTSQQVIYATGLPCAVLPKILAPEEQASLRTGEYLLDWPYSRFAQTLRSISATINLTHSVSNPKVLCVVSSNPGEGKTTVAINLAAHYALNSTTRVLVIDADFHHQRLTNGLLPDARVGLREALVEPFALAKFVVRKERLNLDVLPCPTPDRIPNAAELLGSVEMDQLIEVARGAYDLVIIEVPPMATVVDYKMIARHCNGSIFVVEWGKTSQRLVLECLSDASSVLDNVLCIVLNKADPYALKTIEHYKGDAFHTYYSDQKRA